MNFDAPQTTLDDQLQEDVETANRIPSVPTILEVICRTTGMGFAALARVTDARWVACSVLDQIQFGLKPGDELELESTICHEIRQSREPVVIDHVAEHATWCRHHTPAMYGFQSYISVPVVLEDGTFFGTLCAIDPRPASLNNAPTLSMFRLFAELIAKHLDSRRKLVRTEAALSEERHESELREQFIAVLGHDLRNPLRGVRSFSELLLRTPLEASSAIWAGIIRDSAVRMEALVDNLLDLARGRLAGGLGVNLRPELMEPVLRSVIAELTAGLPEGSVLTDFCLDEPVACDRARMAQLFSNLLSNALTHGAPNQPVRVKATTDEGYFELSVGNAGERIPAAALDHLFKPFYRSAVRHDRDGLGLGLYISQEIAKAHGGTLTVDSTDDETCFTYRMRTAVEVEDGSNLVAAEHAAQ